MLTNSIHQGSLEIFEYLDGIKAMATLLSDFMIEEMKTYSTSNPEQIDNYQLLSTGKEIGWCFYCKLYSYVSRSLEMGICE